MTNQNCNPLTFENREQLVRYSQNVIEVPSAEEMCNLVAKAQSGDGEAREKVVMGTMRYILNTVRAPTSPSDSVTVGDLIGEAVLSLEKAIEKFNPEKGANFLTYASWWIEVSQSEACRKSREITPSKNHIRYISKIQKAIAEGAPETDYAAIAEASGLTEKIVRTTMVTMVSLTSLFDLPPDQDGTKIPSIMDTVASTDPGPMDKIAAGDIRTMIEKSMGNLSPRDRKIMILRYGLFDTEPHTLKDIATIVGISNERVRQIEDTCLSQMKNNMTGMNCSATSDIYLF